MKKLISVVIPFYNEGPGLQNFLDNELSPSLSDINESFEIILIDDGSTDQSLESVENSKLVTLFPHKIISFTKNFGKEIALTAGLKEADGEAVIMIDSDGQHPAEKIQDMIKKWSAGAKIVTAVRAENTTKHQLGSKLYYKLMRLAGDKNIKEGEMDFRLLDREAVDEFLKLTEHNRLTRGLINWLGFRQEYIYVKTKTRASGKPTYGAKKLTSLAGDSLVSASRTPLLIFGYIGIVIMLISGATGLFQLIQEYILHDPLKLEWGGGVAVSMFVAFLVGLVLISQAITALYISQIHAEVKNRPLYVIDKSKSVGLKNDKK